MAAVQQEITRRGGEFEAAFTRGDMAALAAIYTEDATLMPPDSAKVVGREGIQRFWQGVQDAGFRRAVLRTEQVEGSGDLAVEVGTVDLFAESGDGQGTSLLVKYVAVWRRGDDRTWHMAVDIWNGRPAT